MTEKTVMFLATPQQTNHKFIGASYNDVDKNIFACGMEKKEREKELLR